MGIFASGFAGASALLDPRYNQIKGFSVGFVGKYPNAPKIRYGDGYDLRVNPQARMGLGYHWKWLSLAWDLISLLIKL
ncbi:MULTISPECIES: hypothetical protein [Helicobacter]|uniref:hypothetical protein n=1 Tax=Helicobacter TaxID=209 RepID=UPI000EAC334F|nr:MULTISPECIES: hypothetical protein [Helicobacter]